MRLIFIALILKLSLATPLFRKIDLLLGPVERHKT